MIPVYCFGRWMRGGILSESMARLSFVLCVKGIDLSADVLEAAKCINKRTPC